MEKKKRRDYLFSVLGEMTGGEQHTTIRAITTVSTGITEVVVQHEVSQRFPIQELEKAQDLYERLTCGSGRRVYKPEDLAHPYNPN